EHGVTLGPGLIGRGLDGEPVVVRGVRADEGRSHRGSLLSGAVAIAGDAPAASGPDRPDFLWSFRFSVFRFRTRHWHSDLFSEHRKPNTENPREEHRTLNTENCERSSPRALRSTRGREACPRSLMGRE